MLNNSDTSNLLSAQRCVDCSNLIPRTGARGPRKKRCDKCRRDLAKRTRQRLMGVTVPLGSETKCVACGRVIVRTGGNKRFCSKCAADAKRQKNLEGYYFRQGREPVSGAGTEVQCQGCPTRIIKTRSDHVFCRDCIRKRINSYIRKTREVKRREAGVPLRRGETINCDHCKKPMVTNALRHKLCKRCKYQNQIRSNKKRLKTDPIFALNLSLGAAIRKSLRGTKAGHHWETIVGYGLPELMRHLERQFTSKMSWSNRGSYWELEHIRPIASFDITGPGCDDFRECWGLHNLRPFPATENREKRDQRLHLL